VKTVLLAGRLTRDPSSVRREQQGRRAALGGRALSWAARMRASSTASSP